MTAQLTLPARLDLSVAGNLARDILGLQGQPLTIDAAEVTLLGTPGLQVLIAAKNDWAEEGQSLKLKEPTPRFVEQLARFGLTPADLEHSAESPKETSE